MANNNKKYVSLTRLSDFLANLKSLFATKTDLTTLQDTLQSNMEPLVVNVAIGSLVEGTDFLFNATPDKPLSEVITALNNGREVYVTDSYGVKYRITNWADTAYIAESTNVNQYAEIVSTSIQIGDGIGYYMYSSALGKTELHGLVTDLENAINAKASAQHSHVISDVANLQTTLDGKANSTHNHNASDINAGTLSSDRLPTVPISKGGTGSTTAAGALTNLGIIATASELNVLDGITASTQELNYVDGVTSNIQTQLNAKVPNTRTINGKALSVDVSLSASDVGADATGTASSAVSAHNTSTTAHDDIRELISGLTTRLNTLADSDDTTLDQMSELVAYIKSNKSLIDSITTSKVSVADIVDNLTSTATNKPLSAKQGKALKDLIDALTTVVNGKAASSHNHAATEITSGTLSTDRLPTIPISKGGTNATTAAQALVNLGLTATASELNKLDGVTTTTAELNYVDGVTSNIQTQLNNKSDKTHNHEGTGDYSVAIGESTTVSGGQSTAVGQGATITNSNVAAFGQGVTATNDNVVAVGQASIASGSNGIAIGQASEASGVNGIAIGQTSKASGEYTVAIGQATQATSNYSTLVGQYANGGTSSTVVGQGSTAAGGYSVVIGQGATAGGDCGTVVGQSASAAGVKGIAIGQGANAAGDFAAAIGSSANASGSYAYSMGTGTLASSGYQTVVGKYNIEDTEHNYAFILGNGEDENNRSNAVAVRWNGGIEANSLDLGTPLEISSGGTGSSTAYGALENFGLTDGFKVSTYTCPDVPQYYSFWEKVAGGNGTYIAGAGSGYIRSTDNGKTWSSYTPPSDVSLSSFTYANGRFVGASYSGGTASYSTDGGETWTTVSCGYNSNYGSISYANGRYFISAGYRILYSTDGGATWKQSAQLDNSYSLYSTAYVNGTYIIVGASAAFKSIDGGANWTKLTNLPSEYTYKGLHCIDGTLYTIAETKDYAATNIFAKSSDNGATWATTTLPVSQKWRSGLMYNGNMMVISGTDTICYSFDKGATWTVVEMDIPEGAYCCGGWACDNGEFIVMSKTNAYVCSYGNVLGFTTRPDVHNIIQGYGYANVENISMAAYDALESYEPNTLYNITDGEEENITGEDIAVSSTDATTIAAKLDTFLPKTGGEMDESASIKLSGTYLSPYYGESFPGTVTMNGANISMSGTYWEDESVSSIINPDEFYTTRAYNTQDGEFKEVLSVKSTEIDKICSIDGREVRSPSMAADYMNETSPERYITSFKITGEAIEGINGYAVGTTSESTDKTVDYADIRYCLGFDDIDNSYGVSSLEYPYCAPYSDYYDSKPQRGVSLKVIQDGNDELAFYTYNSRYKNIVKKITLDRQDYNKTTNDYNDYPFNFNGSRIAGLKDPFNAQDAATKNYVDTSIAAIPAELPAYTSEDEGKVLRIVNGTPTWVFLTNAEGVSF